jgi:hypothetical protein
MGCHISGGFEGGGFWDHTIYIDYDVESKSGDFNKVTKILIYDVGFTTFGRTHDMGWVLNTNPYNSLYEGGGFSRPAYYNQPELPSTEYINIPLTRNSRFKVIADLDLLYNNGSYPYTYEYHLSNSSIIVIYKVNLIKKDGGTFGPTYKCISLGITYKYANYNAHPYHSLKPYTSLPNPPEENSTKIIVPVDSPHYQGDLNYNINLYDEYCLKYPLYPISEEEWKNNVIVSFVEIIASVNSYLGWVLTKFELKLDNILITK